MDLQDVIGPTHVIDFWFGPPGSAGAGEERAAWWDQRPGFDAEIRERFGETHRRALAGELEGWRQDARGCLAYVLVLDQFSRHLHRGSALAYGGDERALGAAHQAVASRWDLRLPPMQRQFLYMPFMHSEREHDQERSVELFDALALEAPGVDQRRWAHEYLETIRRFGRFPHRDVLLGREV